jgi:phenylpropionate dioxygenase-like ring-hydroxylating dioxygenase large terminal subunit
VPGLLGPLPSSRTRDIDAHATTEQDGFVWIWGTAGEEPTGSPFPLPHLAGRGAGQIIFPCDLDATLHAALENTLDVPHTAFLHRGVFRGATTKELRASRRNLDDGVEVEFEGESVGLGRLQGGPLAGKVFEHWDRFFLPSVAQVEYRVEGWLRIFNTVLHLPLSASRTRAWFVLQWKSPVPAALIRPIVLRRGRKVLGQDAAMLAAQSSRIEAFGGEQFSSTDLDLLGAAIWRLLRRASSVDGVVDLTDDDTIDPAAAVEKAISFRA